MNTLRYELADILLDVLAIIVTDLKTGKITHITHTAEKMFGYNIRNSLLGVCVDELVPEAVRRKHAEHRKTYEETPVTRPMGGGLVLHGQRRDKSTFPVSITLVPVMMGDEAAVVAVMTDLGEAKAT